MAYRRTAAKRRTGGSDGSFWLSFSDLMSSLVLIIVLVLFYIIYQYFNLAEINQAEIARRQYALDEAQTALESRESELASAQATLEAQQAKLTDAEKQMIAQQILLNAKEDELSSAQDVLAAQKTQLADATSALSEKEAQIAAAQSQLDALGAQLSSKQTEIEAREAELAKAKKLLANQQTQLTSQQTQLTAQQTQIAAAQTALSEKEAQIAGAERLLNDQQTQLETQQGQLKTQQSQLKTQQSQLKNQQSQLKNQQSQLEIQQSQLETQQAQLEDQQTRIEALVGLKTRIISSLSAAFRDSSIQATVDPANGSIALESDVLFESAKYALTQRGQKSVDQVLPVYLNVLFSEEYRPYVAEVIIEGHTDSDGTWLNNLALSQQRALAVASYALGDKCRALSADTKNTLKQVVTVNGRSWSDRVFNENGTENKDASRRVVFKFRLTDEEMIRQLQTILESE